MSIQNTRQGAERAVQKGAVKRAGLRLVLAAMGLLAAPVAMAAQATLTFNVPSSPEQKYPAGSSVWVGLTTTEGCGPINIYVSGPTPVGQIDNGQELQNLAPGRYVIEADVQVCDQMLLDYPVTANRAFNVVGGSVSASPSTCAIPWGSSTCGTTVSWNSSAADAQVWKSRLDGSGMTQVAQGQSGSSVVQIESGGHRFHLRSGSLTLATADATGSVTQNSAPSVNLTAPSANLRYQLGDTVRLAASASDPDDGVQRVEFLVDGVKVGEDTSAPYEFYWTGTESWHAITARAFDTRGAQATSAAVDVVGNGRPTVALTSPANGASGAQPASFVLKADAFDHDGILRVEFYADNALVNSDNAAPYEFTWANVGAGSHAIHAIAHDIHGASVRSSTVTVNVTPPATSPQGVTRRYVYDAHRQLCKIIEPETGATVMAYDAAGNLAWSASGLNLPDPGHCNLAEAEASGRKVTRSYDDRNRLQTLGFPDGRGNQAWTYHPDGLVKQVATDNEGAAQGVVVNKYHYNNRRLLTSESVEQPGWYTWTTSYGYDSLGHLRSLTYPSQLAIEFAPNALGQATQAKAGAQTFASGARYYPNGAIAGFTYGNGRVHSMSQNARKLPARVNNGAVDFLYEYDNNANPVQIRDVNGVEGVYSGDRYLVYDGLDRLTRADLFWHSTEDFTYDALDNILTRTELSGASKVYWYDANNRLTNIQNGQGQSVVGLGYDAQGNLQNKNGQEYAFDFGNRLRQVAGKESYRYDAHGRRVSIHRTSDGRLDSMLYGQSGQLLYEWSNRRGERTDYIYLAGSLLAKRNLAADDSASVRYQHTDALGSPVAVSDASGQVVDKTLWRAYGEAIGKPAYDGVGYTGHVMDGATGLTYMQQRYYDEVVGRFLSVDPVTPLSGNDQLFNRYAYSYNSPYTYSDPDGLEARPEIAELDRVRVTAPAPVAPLSSTIWTLGSVTVPAPSFESIPVPRIPSWVSPAIGAYVNAPFLFLYSPHPCGGEPCGELGYFSRKFKPGVWPGDTGAMEWGRRNGVGAKEARRRFHRIKGDAHGGAAEDFGVDPKSGEVYDSNGDHVGDMDQGHQT